MRPSNGGWIVVLSLVFMVRALTRLGSVHSKFALSIDLWQRLRTDLNDHAFGSFDLLFRIEKSRIALQRHQDRLIKCKRGNLA